MSLRTFQETCEDLDRLVWYPTVFIQSNMGINWNMPAKKEICSSTWVNFFVGMNSSEPAELAKKILTNDSPSQLLTLLEHRLMPIIRVLRSKNLERGKRTIKIKRNPANVETDKDGVAWLMDMGLVYEKEGKKGKETDSYSLDVDRVGLRSYLLYTLEDLLTTVRRTNSRKISVLELKVVTMQRELEEKTELLETANSEIERLKTQMKGAVKKTEKVKR